VIKNVNVIDVLKVCEIFCAKRLVQLGIMSMIFVENKIDGLSDNGALWDIGRGLKYVNLNGWNFLRP
jgi:hypothetical protein